MVKVRIAVCQDAQVTAALAPLASVALAALVAVAAYTVYTPLVAVAVGVAVLALAMGWGGLLELPARRGTALVLTLTGWASAVIAVLAIGMVRPLAPFTALLAVAVLLAFAHELIRGQGRPHLVESVTGTLSGEAVALLGGGWVLLPSTRLGLTAVVAAAAATAGARLACLIPLPPRVAGWVALMLGVAAGTLAGVLVDPSQLMPVAVLSGVVSAVVAGLDQVFIGLPATRPASGAFSAISAFSAAAAPVLAVGTVAYAVSRLLS